MSEYQEVPPDHPAGFDEHANDPGQPASEHHHDQNENVADVVVDTDHLMDDFGELFTEVEVEMMGIDEKLFMWFSAHDWDKDEVMDGLELFKALSHDHNYHHEVEEGEAIEEEHDPAQHTPAADRQRFRRTEKIVDQLLAEDDLDGDGALSFPEFMAAFRAGKMDGLKVKKTK